jgi:hypothetical protein
MRFLQIEIMKYKLSKIIYTFFLYISLMAFLLFLLGISTGGMYMYDTMETAIREVNNALIWPGCIVVIGIWSSKIIVQEFKEKTIQIVFSLGIERQSIMRTKIILTVVFGFILTLLSTFLLDLFLNVTTEYMYYSETAINYFDRLRIKNILGDMAISAVLVSFMGILPTAIGIKKYSSSLTYGCSIIIALLWAMQIGFDIFFLSITGIRVIFCLCSMVGAAYIMGSCRRMDL